MPGVDGNRGRSGQADSDRRPGGLETTAELELNHWWFRGRRALLLGVLRERCQRMGKPRPRLLDLGCGSGANSVAYCTVAEVVGLEPATEALRYARERSGPRYVRGEGTRLPFASRSFDLVVASDVLEHIADDARAVREIARVLDAAGVLVFTVPAHPWLWSKHDDALAHHRRYQRKTIRRLLENAGFEVGWLSYWNTVLFPVAAARRLAGRLLQGAEPAPELNESGPALTGMLVLLLRAEGFFARKMGLPLGLSLVGWAEVARGTAALDRPRHPAPA